jgi:hypothetical protein
MHPAGARALLMVKGASHDKSLGEWRFDRDDA